MPVTIASSDDNQHTPLTAATRVLEKRQQTAQRLQTLHKHGLNTHTAQALWRTATASDATFVARTVGLDTNTAANLDQTTLNLLQTLLDTRFDDKDAIRLFSAIAEQGFGFTAATHIKDTALIASWQQTAPKLLAQLEIDSMEELLNLAPKTRQQIQAAIGRIDPALLSTIRGITPACTPTKHQQKQLTAIIRKNHQTQLSTLLTPEEMAAYHSTGGEGAGSWLYAPTENITPMSNAHFNIAAKMRLHKSQNNAAPHACRRRTERNACGCEVMPQMQHVPQCAYGPYRNTRHNALRDELANIIEDITGTRPLTEQLLPQAASYATRSNSSPDESDREATLRADIAMSTANGPMYLDIMITSAFTKHSLAGNHDVSSIVPGTAALHATVHKIQKYAPHAVTPIIFELHGRAGASTLDFLRQLANTLPNGERNGAYHKALQRLATTLQTHNAKSIESYVLQTQSSDTTSAPYTVLRRLRQKTKPNNFTQPL